MQKRWMSGFTDNFLKCQMKEMDVKDREREHVEYLLNIIATGCVAGNEDELNMMTERAVPGTMVVFRWAPKISSMHRTYLTT